jgi:ATP/ADP translocase
MTCGGGDWLKFSDVILAMAAFGVIDVLIDFALSIVLIPSMGSYWGLNSSFILSALVAGLVVGWVFAGNIQEESRVRAVGKIAVLLGAVEAAVVLLSASANGYFNAYVKETLQSTFSTGAWTTTDWFVYTQLALIEGVVLNVVLVLVLSFIGLYAGSMSRKPKKA